MQLTQIAEIAQNGNISSASGKSGGHFHTTIKNGSFKVGDINNARRILDMTTEVLGLLNRMDRVSNAFFIGCYVRFINAVGKEYNHEEFLGYVKTHAKQFALVTLDSEKLEDMFRDSVKYNAKYDQFKKTVTKRVVKKRK